jgi:UDP-3-O-[3-hydroxymyristoyl] glucosamine N-acyltransferase
LKPLDDRPSASAVEGVEVEVAAGAVVYPGTVLGAGCKILDGAVVGKQPSLSPRSSTRREELPPTVIGDGTIVSTGAIVFAGSRIGARVIVGDQACIRERVQIGEDVVVGRGA